MTGANRIMHQHTKQQFDMATASSRRRSVKMDQDTASLGRQHNDANVMGIGARMHGEEEAVALARTFLSTPFSGEERHARRIELLARYEAMSRGAQPEEPATGSDDGSA